MLLILFLPFILSLLIFFTLVFLGKDIGVWSCAGLVLWVGRDGSASGLGWGGWEKWKNRRFKGGLRIYFSVVSFILIQHIPTIVLSSYIPGFYAPGPGGL